MKSIIVLLLCAAPVAAMAQPRGMQYFRQNNQHGINVFETSKNDTTPFTNMKVRLGGNFSQDFQALKHENNATPVLVNAVNTNELAGITSGFTLAMANLNIDAQLEDGIRMNLTLYLSARHHAETWVKGGYVQVDKLAFLKSALVDKIMKNFTIKAGAYEVDYGDQHYRRSDGGNSIYNPFIENYIMDEFATEIGGEVYYHHNNGIIAMGGISNGALNPTVAASKKIDTLTGKLNISAPAFHGKLGYDKQLNKDLRLRFTGSVYAVKSAASNTLFWGDRTGSHYFFVMENSAATATANAWSGRYNPQFSQQVTTFMLNPFVKYKGLELFGTYEMASGRKITEPIKRTATQYAVDIIYRFPAGSENFWIGGRYNSMTAEQPLLASEVTVKRMAGTLGWFVTKNIMMKGEYVSQVYDNFEATDIRSGGKFNGFMAAAVVGF
ncbi:MAG: hypothetical protein V4649_09185 [Bacteroidota bacterium]